MALVYLGGLIAFIGGIWLLVVTFKKSILWGIGSLLLPVVGLVFVILNWDLTKKPFLVYLAGIVLLVIGLANLPPGTLEAPTSV